jgi:hypothetical protein
MDDSFISRIERLERSNRFWKRTSLLLAAVLPGLVIGLVLHQHTVNKMEAARRSEMDAWLAAEPALKEAKERKD